MSDAPPLQDAAARRLAQVEFARPVVLEAGAGTGKTTALVARLLAWTVGIGWERTRLDLATLRAREPDEESVAGAMLERVVAITFTEAAAAEMAERYQRELAQFADDRSDAEGGHAWPPTWLVAEAFPPESGERARRARALLAAVDRLRVQTIHSFAFSLLRRHALELGLHPALAVDADERVLDEVLHAAVTDLLPPRYRSGDPALERLASDGIGPLELADAVRSLAGLGLASTELDRDPFEPQAIAAAVAPLADSARVLLRHLETREIPKKLAGAAALRSDLAPVVARLEPPPDEPAALESLREELDELLSGTARNKLDKWRRGDLVEGERALFGDAAPALVAAARTLRRDLDLVGSLDVARLAAARLALAPLCREVERRLRLRGAVTFSDLLRLAAQLLDRERVAARLRRGIDQLLVDEFQDTDELQAVLVRRLALEGPEAERPGLFLVGDPKQSIYGWRRARLSVYRDLVERATGATAGLAMTANFRSAAGILAEVERVVAPLMPEESDTAARFEALEARGARRDEPAEVEYWLSWPSAPERAAGKEALGAAESARREAAAVAADLAQRIAHGALAPGDAAILMRGKTHLETYLEALRDRGVPFAVEKDRSYFRRRETMDAGALVRAVLDPADLVALTTWLRSPFVGVPDAALVPLFRAGLPERLGAATVADDATLAELGVIVDRAVAAMPRDVPGLERVARWPRSLRTALAALLDRRAAFEREDALLWIDRLRAAFRPELVAAARYQGAHRLANLDRFFRELGARFEAGEAPHRALGDLRRTVAEGSDAPEGRPLESADDAVRLMTLHSAKGLEFEEVYLVGLHQRTGARQSASEHAAERVGERWEYRLFGVPTPGFAPVRDLDERIRAAEQVRLLYVGMTRAIRRLVMVGALPPPRSSTPTEASTLAQLLAARLPDDEDFAAALDGSRESAWRDRHGVLWRLVPGAVPARQEPSPPVAGTEAQREPSDLLAERARARRSALARRERSRLARITEIAEVEPEREPAPGEPEATSPRFPEFRDEAREEALARGTGLHRALELVAWASAEPVRWRAAARSAFERALPTTGAPVVVDFKSDRIDEAGVEALRARYAPQLALYAEAVRRALGLASAPRTELWLLAVDRVVPLD